MTRATSRSTGRAHREEPNDSREQNRTVEAGDSEDTEAVRANDSALHSTLDRVRPRENLVRCVLCNGIEIPSDKFRLHMQYEHRGQKQGVPTGYYGCWSGAEFWYPLGPAKGPCKWLCSACGKVLWFYGKEENHGGPPDRLLDRRYGLYQCPGSRYPDHKRYLGKIDGGSGQVVFYHEGAPNPAQPDQTDAEWRKDSDAKGVSGRAHRETGGAGDSEPPKRLRGHAKRRSDDGEG